MNNVILANFFSSYFHQDWMDDAIDDLAVIDSYRESVSTEEASLLANAIEHDLIKGSLDDTRLSEYLHSNLGCYFDPTAAGLTAREWLQRLTQLLRPANADVVGSPPAPADLP